MNKSNQEPKVATNRTFVGKFNWNEIEDSLHTRKLYFPRNIAFVANTPLFMYACEKSFGLDDLQFRNFTNFESMLSIGADRTADIVVLIDQFASASRKNFAKLLRQRSHEHLQVIIWDGSSVDQLMTSIQKSLSLIDQTYANDFVVDKIIESRRTSSEQVSQANSSTTTTIMAENEFRNLLNRELKGNLSQSPEDVLAKAIEIIKKLK